MRLPQVSERIKEAPAQALRGVFAGIGQVLLITDKLRNKTAAGQEVPRARTPEPSETAAPAPEPAPAAPVSVAPSASAAAPDRAEGDGEKAVPARDPDKTGNVRLLTSHDTAASTAPAVAAEVAVDAEAAIPAEAEGPADATAEVADAAVDAEVADATAEAVDAGPPLPNYGELSIASLRARLRNLDVGQVRQLAEYERAHAGRADVIAMYERRIAKLQAETTPEERGEAEGEAEIEAQDDVETEIQDDVEAEAEGET
jgi:hypothetical protein